MTEFGPVAFAVFLASVAVGMAIHELSHGAVLRYYGYRYRYHVGPDDDAGDFVTQLTGATARVEWSPFEERARGVEITVGALAPLAICIPALALFELDVVAGLVDYALAGLVFTTIPSPQDFGLAWRGLRSWDDYLAGALEAVANHELAEGYDSIL